MKQALFSILFSVICCFCLPDTALAQAVSERSKSIVTLGGQRYYVHTVVKGDTFYHLGKLYNVTEAQVLKDNPHVIEGLKLGQILKIPVDLQPASNSNVVSSGGSDFNDKRSANQRQVNPAALFPSSRNAATQPDEPQNRSISHIIAGDERANEYMRSGSALSAKQFNTNDPLKIAVMLPLRVGSTNNRQFLEFYQGVLVALGELKSLGISIDVDLYNTARSASAVDDIVRDGSLANADLIIGPIYNEGFDIVADYAAGRGIPIVSPLAAIESSGNSLQFQMAPLPANKNDKLREDFTDDKNVIVFSTSSNDADLVKDITPLLPASARRINYSNSISTATIEGMLSGERENVIVVLSSNENSVDEILSRISSIQNNLVSRSIKNPMIKVVGSSRWARFQNIEKNLFFKLHLRYMTSYHADRSDPRVDGFDSRYVSEFGSLPTLYSYRGYDVARLFVGAIMKGGSNFRSHLNDTDIPLLQTRYLFGQRESGGKFENRSWAKVCYNSDYTIIVK